MTDIKNIRNKLDNILNEGLGEMADMVERDHEVQMARSDLYKTAKYAIKLHGMLKNVSETEGLQGWVQSKITKAADYMGSVQHYMEYEMTPPDMQLALAQTESEMNEEKMKMVKGPDGKMIPSFAADGKGKNDLKKKVNIKEDATDMKKHEVLTKIGRMLTMLEEQVYELQQHDQGDAYTSGSGDLTDQIVTMDKLMDNFEAVTARAQKIVPTGSIHRDESVELEEEGAYGIGDSNHEIIMGFVNQWTEAGQPDNYMDDLIAYVKKTIPDSKDWKYAASLIKNGVKSYQDREYGTSSLMGLRNNTESVEVTQENIIVEGEMEAAESVMAAKNIVDRIQGMMEDLGEIVNEDLPALTDTITDNQGAEMAQNYSAAVSGAVNAALEAIRAAREGVDGAARMLTGEAVAPAMGADPAAEMPMEPTTDMDMALPAEEEIPATDEIATSDAATGGEEELGRERRV